jgi:hypothetical protein
MNLVDIEPSLPSIVCCSLGPEDGVMVVEGYLVSTGLAAAAQKVAIESYKVAGLRGSKVAGKISDLLH